jgi:hypothetical protein
MKIIKSSNHLSLLSRYRQWQLIPFLVLGLLVFSLNSLIEVNYFIGHYLIILEIQTAIIGSYFIFLKLRKYKNKNYRFTSE